MAIIRKKLSEIVASKPKLDVALYDETTEAMIAQQRKAEGCDVELLGRWKKVDNKKLFSNYINSLEVN